MDIDVDMDLDIDPDELYSTTDVQSLNPTLPPSTATVPIPPFDSQLLAQKIHVRGLDNLTSSDLKAYAAEHAASTPIDKVEWIDDTSANIVFKSREMALEALRALVSEEIPDPSQLSPLQMLPAKKFTANPQTRLEIRFAVTGDRKQAGARDRSRFYLFNPQHDPAETRKKEGYDRREGRRYRDRDEHRPRRGQDVKDFDANLYDDDENSRAARASTLHNSANPIPSVSSGSYRGHRDRRTRRPSAKELFPDLITPRNSGRLRNRDRSASPAGHDYKQLRRIDSSSGSIANRLKAQMIKARLKEAGPEAKELFPQKASIIHRRSDAFDAADITAELFSKKMHVPFVDGSNDLPSEQQDLMSRGTTWGLEDRVSSVEPNNGGFTIRGSAKSQSATGFSIKGAASTIGTKASVKELFPTRAGQNSGKELFSDKLEGRGVRRRRAEDMFY